MMLVRGGAQDVAPEQSNTCAPLAGEAGQAMVEYILVLATVVSIFLIVAKGIDKLGLMRRLFEPLSTDFAAMYQYGHPKADRYPASEKHPRRRVYIEVPQ